MNELITDAMAETAAKARWDYKRVESGDPIEWEMHHPAFREFDTEAMRAALESAAPAIAAQALMDASDALVMGHKPDGISTWQWLRDRAKLTSPTEPREDHAATDPLDDPAVRLLRDIFVGDPLDEDDHRPRHFADGEHLYWVEGCGGWHLGDASPCSYPHAQADGTTLAAWVGPLTFCDCDATIEAENGATD